MISSEVLCATISIHMKYASLFFRRKNKTTKRKTRNLNNRVNAPKVLISIDFTSSCHPKSFLFCLRPPRRANNWRNSFNWINQFVFYCLRLNDCEKILALLVLTTWWIESYWKKNWVETRSGSNLILRWFRISSEFNDAE